jgi:radical SAM protein with 4Fe4S-binding SPASM domain
MLKKAYLEITNVCNMDCSFCHKTVREKRVMSEEEFELLTDRLRGKAEQLYFHLMGEPTLHPLLPKFVRRARKKGFLPIITTNGTLLGKVGEALIAAAPYKVSISLHAPAANAAFADAAYLDNCISFARRAAEGGAYVALRLWNLGGDGEGENAAILSRLRAEFDGEWVNIRGGASQRIATRIFLEWGEHFDWPDLCAPAASYDADAFCYGLRDQIGVLCDGSVVPCCLDSDGVITLGNLFDGELDDILATPRAKAIYDGFSRRRAAEELCRRCGYARRFCRK